MRMKYLVQFFDLCFEFGSFLSLFFMVCGHCRHRRRLGLSGSGLPKSIHSLSSSIVC